MSKTRKPGLAGGPNGAGPRKFRLKLIGIGGGGGNTISHVNAAREANPALLDGAELIAINTDAQTLEGVTGAELVQIGASITHGLGTGGDPELGARAAQADNERLEALLQHSDLVFLTAGLGGGTGGGAAATVARLAKSQGALVLGFVTLPFGFEGPRRREAALACLDQLKAQADAVICIPNDRLLKLVGENASARDALQQCDAMIATAAQSVWQLMSRKGLINLDFADLRAVLGQKQAEGLFACGAGSGPDRVKLAVESLLAHPLLDDDHALARTDGLLISILGGPDLSLSDVQKAVEPITRVAQRAKVIMGAAIDDDYQDKLSITVIAATQLVPRKAVEARAAQPVADQKARAVSDEAGAAVPKRETPKPRQEQLPLDNISRGRFDKSEPTIYAGEDLDVPTFLRQGVVLVR